MGTADFFDDGETKGLVNFLTVLTFAFKHPVRFTRSLNADYAKNQTVSDYNAVTWIGRDLKDIFPREEIDVYFHIAGKALSRDDVLLNQPGLRAGVIFQFETDADVRASGALQRFGDLTGFYLYRTEGNKVTLFSGADVRLGSDDQGLAKTAANQRAIDELRALVKRARSNKGAIQKLIDDEFPRSSAVKVQATAPDQNQPTPAAATPSNSPPPPAQQRK